MTDDFSWVLPLVVVVSMNRDTSEAGHNCLSRQLVTSVTQSTDFYMYCHTLFAVKRNSGVHCDKTCVGVSAIREKPEVSSLMFKL